MAHSKAMETQSTLTPIKAFSGSPFDPISKTLFLLSGCIVGVLLVIQGTRGLINPAIGIAVWLLSVIVILVPIILCFSYVDLDEHHITNSFRIGKFVHYKLRSINWNEVSHVKVSRSSRPSTVNLKITTKDGKTVNFSIAKWYAGSGERFEEIARLFPAER